MSKRNLTRIAATVKLLIASNYGTDRALAVAYTTYKLQPDELAALQRMVLGAAA